MFRPKPWTRLLGPRLQATSLRRLQPIDIYFYPHTNPVPRHASAKGRIFDLGFIVISHVVILALVCLSGPAKPTFIGKTGSFDCLLAGCREHPAFTVTAARLYPFLTQED